MKKMQKEQDLLLDKGQESRLLNTDTNLLGGPDLNNTLALSAGDLTQSKIKKKYKFGDGTRKLINKIKEKQVEKREKKAAKNLQKNMLTDISRIDNAKSENGAFSDDDRYQVQILGDLNLTQACLDNGEN